jgi:hypothetical protein
MAVFKNGVLGSYRNGIGNIVTYRSGGQDIARTKPASFKDANSEAQQEQRSIFKQALELYRVCSTTVKITNPERGAKYSPYNVFMKENTNKSISSEGVRLADLVLSKGSLKEVIPGAISGAGENNVDITWPDNTNNTTAFANDRVVVTLIREDTLEVISEVSQVQRSAGAIGVALPESWDDTNIFAYVSFVSTDMKKASANSRPVRFRAGSDLAGSVQ